MYIGKFLDSNNVGLLDYLYLGVKLGIYPCIIFIGVGAMTDFGPLLANPKSFLLGAAAQLGFLQTFLGSPLPSVLPMQKQALSVLSVVLMARLLFTWLQKWLLTC